MLNAKAIGHCGHERNRTSNPERDTVLNRTRIPVPPRAHLSISTIRTTTALTIIQLLKRGKGKEMAPTDHC